MQIFTQNPSATLPAYMQMHGALEFTPTNNIMFKDILQNCNNVLRGLVGALLHIKDKDIQSVVVTNPEEFGDSPATKQFVLDIKLMLNDDTLVGIEMQVLNEGNWPDRSLSYLCRTFDNLNSGEDYTEVRPAYHIGFLDFTLFPQAEPEFYAVHKIMNVKTGQIYNDKFTLNVIDLTQIDKATAEDKAWRIDEFARLFKATTWEELQMLAQENANFNEACNRIHVLTADEMMVERMRVQARHEARERYCERTMAEQKEQLDEKDNQLTEKDKQLAMKDSKLAQQTARIAELEAKLTAAGL